MFSAVSEEQRTRQPGAGTGCPVSDRPLKPFLSPVRTQILMSALASLAMVSGTPS